MYVCMYDVCMYVLRYMYMYVGALAVVLGTAPSPFSDSVEKCTSQYLLVIVFTNIFVNVCEGNNPHRRNMENIFDMPSVEISHS